MIPKATGALFRMPVCVESDQIIRSIRYVKLTNDKTN